MKNITLPRLGALLANTEDTATASGLFAQSAESIAKLRRERGTAVGTDWAFYASFWNPAQARLALEADWKRMAEQAKKPAKDEHDTVGWTQLALAKAMSAVDVERALEWARQLSDKPAGQNPSLNPSLRAGVLAFIGELLLTEPEKRRLLVVGVESGYDS
jgi:hypothetical protein